MMKRIPLIILVNFVFVNSYSQSLKNADIKIKEKTFIYKTVDKISIKADLFQSTDDNALKPVIVWIHGGGLIFGSRTGLPEEQKIFYLKAGYSVVSIDYRLAPETKLSEIVNDIKDAIQWVRLNGSDSLRIDSTKIFVHTHRNEYHDGDV